MQNAIFKTIESKQVRQVTDRLHFRKDEMWHLLFDSGIEYLEVLKSRISHKRVFDAQFRPVMKMPGFGKLNLSEVFVTIRNSPAFWMWWSSQTWCICRQNNSFADKTELFYRLQFNTELIPPFILKKIFNGQKKPSNGTGAEGQPALQIGNTGSQARTVGDGVEPIV